MQQVKIIKEKKECTHHGVLHGHGVVHHAVESSEPVRTSDLAGSGS